MVTRVDAEKQGIQSIEIGFRLLQTLVAHGRPMMLRDLAKTAGMSAAKAHRYLVSYMRAGLVEQDPGTSRYDLGSFALDLGLARMARIDPVRLAGPILEDLCEEIQETVALAVWGNQGATIVRVADAGGAVLVSLRPGAVLPLMNSATGKIFAAFGRSPFLRKALDEELKEAARLSKVAVTIVRRNLEKGLLEVRDHGLARASGSLTPGINGLSAPVFDQNGNLVAAVTTLGSVGNFDCEWDAPVTRAVKAAAARLSRLLGYGPPDLLPLPVATAAQGDGADVQPDELLEDGDAALDDGEEGELADATE